MFGRFLLWLGFRQPSHSDHAGHDHGHDHGHEHDHGHAHAHAQLHGGEGGHGHSHSHDHVHGHAHVYAGEFAVDLHIEAVAQTPGERAGSFLRVGSENGHLVRHTQ